MADLPLVEVAIALVWRNAELLVTRRLAGAHLGGFWEFPGGKLLPGESAEHCAEREVLEEVGIVCRARGRRQAIGHDYPERRVVLHPVDCEFVGGTLELRGVADARFVAPRDLAGYDFPPANSALIDVLCETER